ncbi:hypothetical protein [Exiguobacterium sp. SH3S1]|uniref:hypothetical protein n=1 Tax=Exiguobacterium sp. SH3S1 TaxID=2510955 RepID=UPI00103C911B|nr:hypothetical protein [Exiguobacterium sp. SH3S1]TCI60165.1 hypothetical protein EVJ26_11910 [Exiguobacterium sp. SH3S1]
MTIIYSLLSALYAVFLYFSPAAYASPYETAEYFASYDRDVNSWENVELFESLGTELDLEMDRFVHYASVPSHWTTLTIEDDERFDGVSHFILEAGFDGEVIQTDWNEPIDDVEGKVVVLPMTVKSLELDGRDTSADPYGEVLIDDEANRHLLNLLEAGAEGYIVTPDEQEEAYYGTIYTSPRTRLPGIGVDVETADRLTDGTHVSVEPFVDDEVPYVEFIQPGKTDEEIVILARLDGTGYGDHALWSLGGSSILYALIEQMDGIDTDATIRYVFLNGSGGGYETAMDYLETAKQAETLPSLVLSLDILGTGEDARFVRTKGMTRLPVLEQGSWSSLDVKPLGTSYLDEFHAEGVPVMSLSDSLTAEFDALTEADTIDRLSNEAMEDHVAWLTDWLATQ